MLVVAIFYVALYLHSYLSNAYFQGKNTLKRILVSPYINPQVQMDFPTLITKPSFLYYPHTC